MFVIGIDVGGTSIKLGVVKDGGDIVYRDQRGTPHSIEEMIRVLREMAESAWQQYPGAEIGISCAGTLDSEGNITANQMGWVNAPINKLLTEQFGRPVPLENDAVCALIAEHHHGALKGFDTGILLTLGTGIGGGLIIGGQPARGYRGMHGEIGHLITHPNGILCGCGQRGCWEQYAAARALQNMADGLSVQDIMAQVKSGGMTALWQSYIDEVVLGLSSLMMIFMPDVIAFGGGLSNAGSVLVDSIREAAQKTSAFKRYCPFTRFVSARFQNDAGILGAATLVS